MSFPERLRARALAPRGDDATDAVVAVVLFFAWRPVLFQLGGGVVSVGHSMQEAVGGFERGGEVGTPDGVLHRIEMHNAEASASKR